MSEMLQIAKITKNPFSLVADAKVTIWAGYEELRKQLQDIIESCRSDRVGLSEFVILHGEVGTGKSHALRYLKNYIEDEKRDEYQAQVVYLESLKFAPTMDFLALYRRLIDELHDHIKETAEWLDIVIEEDIPNRAALRATEIEDRKKEKYRDKQITPTFPPLALLLRGIYENDDHAYKILSGDSGKALNLSDFDMSSPIDNEFSAVKCLGAYINLCTRGTMALQKGNELGRNKAFYFFLDEIEMLTDFKPAEVVSINQGIRDLINACPENTCFLFGLSGDIRLLFVLFDKYVLSRMSRDPIPIEPLDDQQAFNFLKEVLKCYRSDNSDPAEYPFREVALRKIAEETTEKTARELFRSCHRVLKRAVLENRLKPEGWIEEKDVEDLI